MSNNNSARLVTNIHVIGINQPSYDKESAPPLGHQSNEMIQLSIHGQPIKISSTQIQILRLIAAGFTIDLIAQNLFITSEEVSFECSQLLNRSGLKSIKTLVNIGIQEGIL